MELNEYVMFLMLANYCCVNCQINSNEWPIIFPRVFCKIQATFGFYPAEPIAIINYVQSPIDCTLLCLNDERCLSGNIFKIGHLKFSCWLHSSTAEGHRESQIIKDDIVGDVMHFGFIHCSKERQINHAPVNHGEKTNACGIRPLFFKDQIASGQPLRTKRIIDGFTAEPYSQPWIGTVMENNEHICGISLIAKSVADTFTMWGISAAHCFYADDGVTPFPHFRTSRRVLGFLFGVHDYRLFTPHTIYRQARHIKVHPKFDPVKNDIALVEFTRRVYFNDYIRPICLPPDHELKNGGKIEFHTCMTCGWGIINSKTLQDSNTLNCITVPITSFPSKKYFKGDRLEYKMFHLKWQGNLKGACLGDSGSPFVCQMKQNDPFQLFGITSAIYEAKSGEKHSYNVFTHVHLHLKWINEVLTGQDKIAPVTSKKWQIICNYWRFPRCFQIWN